MINVIGVRVSSRREASYYKIFSSKLLNSVSTNTEFILSDELKLQLKKVSKVFLHLEEPVQVLELEQIKSSKSDSEVDPTILQELGFCSWKMLTSKLPKKVC